MLIPGATFIPESRVSIEGLAFFIKQNYIWKESVHGLLEITWLE
jgi:hypothetical protein